MPKGQLVATPKKQFADVPTLLKDPSRRAKLQSFVDETIRCRSKILGEQAQIKAIRDAAVGELGLDPKTFGTIVKLYFDNSFDQKLEEVGKLEEMIHALLRDE